MLLRSQREGYSSGDRNPIENLLENLAGTDTLSFPHNPAANNAVAKHRHHQLFNVIGGDVVATAHQSHALGGAIHGECSASRYSEGQLLVLAGGIDQFDDVISQRIVHADLTRRLLKLCQLLSGEDRLELFDRFAGAMAAEDLPFRCPIRVADFDPEHESVQLILREGIGPLEFKRVLRRQDEEGPIERIGLAFDRNLPLHHGFQQGTLRAGGRPVDFVRQQHVGEDRPFAKLKLSLVWQKDARPQNIAGEQIGRALETGKTAVETLRNRLGERGFPDSRGIFNQQVTFTEQSHNGQANDGFFPQENGTNVLLQGVNPDPGL